MAPRRWINKKDAQHFTVVHRPQNDPRIHDDSAPAIVLNPTALPNSNKVKKLDDLASELGSEAEGLRENEGEAANHGIYYDDTEYDYMQHMRGLGEAPGAYWVSAADKNKGKGKGKQSLEDALREATIQDKPEVLFDEEILPSKNLRKVTYQAQQDVPDALAGFQPDMDPRIREVLIALEDDAYVDDEEDIFGELAKDRDEIDENEFEQGFWEDEDEGWESDGTAKPTKEYKDAPVLPGVHFRDDEREDHGDGVWMEEFSKFKSESKSKSTPKAQAPSQSDLQSSMMTTTTNGGRRKKRKGALTNASAYSMTSSSMFRTEGLSTLDARFEILEEQYNEDMDDMVSVSAASSTTSVTGPPRADFDNILDDFLGSYSMSGKKNVKKGKYQTGMEQLDEVRQGLGPALFRTRQA